MTAGTRAGDRESFSSASTTKQRIAHGAPLLLDGATGTELERLGVPSALPLWSTVALLDAPEALAGVHEAYARAGADVVTANTFRTQARVLSLDPRTEGRAEELTRLAVDCARRGIDAASAPCFVAGSAPPLEDCYLPDRVPANDQLEAEHTAHAENLVKSGVDLILIETMNCIREAVAATAAAKQTGLPFWVSFICDPNGRLLSGEPLGSALDGVGHFEPELVAVNCLPPSAVDGALDALSRCGFAFGVYANLGAPYPNSPDKRVEDHDPASFVEQARHWVARGARMVGGCCGTTPEHIRTLRNAFPILPP
ncbi:MAG: homocysteine S-methyltransferase family protein [Myxococcota bacterium]|jgi:S-methylmethionine-dependent homocysteine/selenocysteine methylase|nr:homocysteine S-methyltransferase family protein [Myxococcota bacterium]